MSENEKSINTGSAGVDEKVPEIQWPKEPLNGPPATGKRRRKKRWQRQRHSKDHAPTPEEFERLLDAARDERDRLSILVLGEGGFRANEFLHIRPAWLDGGHRVTIPLADPLTGFAAKTDMAARSIPLRKMSRYAWDVLVDYLEKHGEIDFKYHSLRNRTLAAAKRAGVEKQVTPHPLRAYCATKWAYRIQNPFTLMELFGWATPGVAIAYVRSTGVQAEKAVDRWNLGNV